MDRIRTRLAVPRRRPNAGGGSENDRGCLPFRWRTARRCGAANCRNVQDSQLGIARRQLPVESRPRRCHRGPSTQDCSQPIEGMVYAAVERIGSSPPSMLRGVKSMRQLFAKTGGPNAAANGSSTIRRVWKPRFCMSVTVRTSRENTNPKRRRGARQFDCGKEDGPSLTRRVSMTDHLDFGGDRREVSRLHGDSLVRSVRFLQ